MIQTTGSQSPELQLLAIVQSIFDEPTIGLDDDFFELGGNSITAIKLISAVEECFGEGSLEPDALFQHGRLRAIAAAITPARAA